MPILPGDGPRTRELYAAIRRLIEAGLAPSGAKLPTTRDLARRFGLSRAAAVAAFELLVAEGFAEARIGAGTFVARAVPRLPAAVAADPPEHGPTAPLPCTLGVAMGDARTLRIFRGLLSRHLARPGPEHFGYGDPRGGLALRRAIAAYLRSARGVRCDPSRIVITSGTQQGLDLVARAALGPDDAVWIEDPCYPMARAALANAGGRLVGVPVDAEGLDPGLGEALCPGARAVYVTPSHQFPLGVTMTMRRRLALIDWARRAGAWIIEDDYDSEFRYAGPPLTALQGADDAGRVAYLGTFSKVLFPGLRVGYAVLPEPLLEAVLALRALTDRQPPTLVEAALADLLDEGHFAAHLRRARRRAEAGRDALIAGLREHAGAGLAATAPEQGLHLVAALPPRLPDRPLAAAAKAAGVGARALSPMFVDAPARQGLVLGFSGFSSEALRAAAAKLGALLR
ncbi:GntR family transcriptional regulator/MocR family aminotransferase [Labrys wisconsinensis]|uniref:GntR family transcriptional regulator/MocR family aminotransferase n=2 Tax=Labrys wisconsinensis TaxID=425677 RepID=A0ABU0JH10_9HYPH|nr:PLP-dependent aminotransferase family protein [Labrys wisconsinensis]MDQ0473577.1 GntR family transcriptional regulator/MocR family aminotransferase [Labrys wisconsinensis]